MIIVNQELLREYSENDYIASLLDSTSQEMDRKMTSHIWLKDSLPKRMVYHHLYGDILAKPSKGKSILDVGGGYTSLSRRLLANSDYYLLDFMAHDKAEDVRSIEKAVKKQFWLNEDWYGFDTGGKSYDIVIANDLFPNVDQRLELFLKKFIPICSEIRVSLTYWNVPRFYLTKRTDADEILCMCAWDGKHLRNVLQEYSGRIDDRKFEGLLDNKPSLWPNQRQVALMTIRGDLKR